MGNITVIGGIGWGYGGKSLGYIHYTVTLILNESRVIQGCRSEIPQLNHMLPPVESSHFFTLELDIHNVPGVADFPNVDIMLNCCHGSNTSDHIISAIV